MILHAFSAWLDKDMRASFCLFVFAGVTTRCDLAVFFVPWYLYLLFYKKVNFLIPFYNEEKEIEPTFGYQMIALHYNILFILILLSFIISPFETFIVLCLHVFLRLSFVAQTQITKRDPPKEKRKKEKKRPFELSLLNNSFILNSYR